MTSSSLTITNPANGEVISRVAVDSAGDVGAKLARARASQGAWAAVPLRDRQECLRRFASALVERREPLSRTLTSEVGKPIAQSRAEIASTGDRLRFFLDHTAALIAEEIVLQAPQEGLEEKITYEPLGVIANISAWNYPYFVGSNVFAPALLTGNAVLYKPSEYATLTGVAIVELLHDSGIPEDVILPVLGAGEAGAELVAQPTDAVFFTGSYATGRHVARAAAERLARVQLELGGKDPIYVCDDVPVAQVAAAVADGAFYNTGQSCCAVERIYVHRGVFRPFVDAFVEQVKAFRVGDPMDEGTYIGPVTRAAQVAFLEAQVADALERGASLLCGGARLDGPGNYFAPTVLVDVDHSMRVMREESFGPIIGIQAVDGDGEAAQRMADTEYGLTAGVYSRDRDRAHRILAGLNTGSSYWNCCDRSTPRLPWSGRRHSGLGTTLSHHGIRAFLQPKAWHLKALK